MTHGDFVRDLVPAISEGQPVTRLLYERLTEEDVAEVDRRMAESPDFHRLGCDPTDQALHRSLMLCFGMWLGVPGIAERVRLLAAQPPEEVHAMARGPLAAAGGLYDADLVVGALADAGVNIESVRTGLDFGCSSGRVVRVLAAAYPQVRWLGCDPNEQAIAWADRHLPIARFFVSAQKPPLPVEDGALDLVYAISIWSHFAPGLAFCWFDAMRRIIRSGGHLVCTVHGLQSVAYYAATGMRSLEQSDEIARQLYRRGWWYAPEFGESGDWGVVNSEWGTAFFSPEWMLTNLCPEWRVLAFGPGRNQGNQDIYVLERA